MATYVSPATADFSYGHQDLEVDVPLLQLNPLESGMQSCKESGCLEDDWKPQFWDLNWFLMDLCGHEHQSGSVHLIHPGP